MGTDVNAGLDDDLELLGATGERHAATMSTRSCIHLSAAIDALTDPLVPPRLSGVDDTATADLGEVLRAVRGRLLRAAQQAGDVQRTIALGFAARELTHALAALTPDPTGPTGSTAGLRVPSIADGEGHTPPLLAGHDAEPALGRPGRTRR